MKTCISCGMPLDEAHGLGTETVDGPVCQYCLGEDGHPKACDVIFEGGVEFFMSVDPEMDRAMGERITRRNMNSLPYWQAHGTACLEGEQATEDEFNAVMAKL